MTDTIFKIRVGMFNIVFSSEILGLNPIGFRFKVFKYKHSILFGLITMLS